MIAASPLVAEFARWGVALPPRQRLAKGAYRGMWIQRGHTRDQHLFVDVFSDDAATVRRVVLLGLLLDGQCAQRNGLLMQIALGVALPEWRGGGRWLTEAIGRLARDPRESPVVFGDGWLVGLAHGGALLAASLTIAEVGHG